MFVGMCRSGSVHDDGWESVDVVRVTQLGMGNFVRAIHLRYFDAVVERLRVCDLRQVLPGRPLRSKQKQESKDCHVRILLTCITRE